MVRLYLISNKSLSKSVLEKKLAIALKALLVLEATAKVALIVKGVLIEKGTPSRPRRPIYSIFTVICSHSGSSRCKLHTLRRRR